MINGSLHFPVLLIIFINTKQNRKGIFLASWFASSNYPKKQNFPETGCGGGPSPLPRPTLSERTSGCRPAAPLSPRLAPTHLQTTPWSCRPARGSLREAGGGGRLLGSHRFSLLVMTSSVDRAPTEHPPLSLIRKLRLRAGKGPGSGHRRCGPCLLRQAADPGRGAEAVWEGLRLVLSHSGPSRAPEAFVRGPQTVKCEETRQAHACRSEVLFYPGSGRGSVPPALAPETPTRRSLGPAAPGGVREGLGVPAGPKPPVPAALQTQFLGGLCN